ncbi:MAG: hypothetical protein JST19_01650 [Bacteroidetes bacterium]|nr:hypothetical protein [Bacteroidota bacterium]
MKNPPGRALLAFIILGISLSIFVFSLSQDTFCIESGCRGQWDGAFIFLFGGLLSFASPAGLSWLANPFIIASWLTIKKNNKASLVLSLLALLFSISFLFFKKVADDESGDLRQITTYQSGYWLWLSSIAIMAVGNLFLFIKFRKQGLA